MFDRYTPAGWPRPKGLRGFASVVGVGAVVAAAVLAISQPDNGIAGPSVPVAGSGSAPVNTSYVQPVTGGMNLGGTAIETTPPSALVTSVAVPAIKAGH
jgi:hypothetical protein